VRSTDAKGEPVAPLTRRRSSCGRACSQVQSGAVAPIRPCSWSAVPRTLGPPSNPSVVLVEKMCAAGQTVERRVLPSGDHVAAAIPTYEQGLEWLLALQAKTSAPPSDGRRHCRRPGRLTVTMLTRRPSAARVHGAPHSRSRAVGGARRHSRPSARCPPVRRCCRRGADDRCRCGRRVPSWWTP